MFYAIKADEVYEFSRRRLRDTWVADGPPDVNAEGYRASATARDSLVRRAEYAVDGDGEAWQIIATRRVGASPGLRPYRDLLVDYDWCKPQHWAWVATAPEREIVSWARDTQAQTDA